MSIDCRAIADLVSLGLDQGQVADALGVHRTTVRRAGAAVWADLRDRRHRRQALAHALRQSGMSWSRLGRQLGVPRDTARYMAERGARHAMTTFGLADVIIEAREAAERERGVA